jgi:asparagine synthetase B (glutamine-hydrolysing)
MPLYFIMQVLSFTIFVGVSPKCRMSAQSASKRLFFARDPLGRRSLLIHKPTFQQPYFFLASVSAGLDLGYEMKELSTEYIYSLDLQRLSDLQDVRHLAPRLPDRMPDMW